jgi:hypothetical protein
LAKDESERTDPDEGERDAEGATATRKPPGSVRLPLTIGAVMILLFVIGGLVFKKSTPKPFKTVGSRAVVLPAGDRARFVVVPPCSPPTVINAANASSQISVPGAVAVGIPKGAASRTIIVPRCGAKAAPMPGALNRPSAAFVLGPREQVSALEKVPKGGDPLAYGITQQITVPGGSPVTTIVAPQCDGKATALKTTILKPSVGGVAVAPRC